MPKNPDAPKMPLDEFWKVVKELNWGHKSDGPDKTTDYTAMKRALMQKFDRAGAERLHNTFDAVRSPLYKALDKEVSGTGDDGFGDLLAHIIGLGKEEYERNLANPKLAQERVNKHRYEESFSYCLPYKDDYEMLTPAHYVDRAQRITVALEDVLKDDRFEPVQAETRRLMAILQPALDGKPLDMLPLEEEAKTLIKKLDARAEWLMRGHGGLDLSIENGIPNLFGDIASYLA